MNTDGISRSQLLLVAKIAKKFLGPFANDDERRASEKKIGDLVLSATPRAGSPPPSPPPGLARYFRPVAKISAALATEIRRGHPFVRWHLTNSLEIDVDRFTAQLDQIQSSGEFLNDAPKPKKGRRPSPRSFRMQELLRKAQEILKQRRKRHGHTRSGNLAEFARQIWDCANGTTSDAEMFSYHIDHLQKEDRRIEDLRRRNSPAKEPAPPSPRVAELIRLLDQRAARVQKTS